MAICTTDMARLSSYQLTTFAACNHNRQQQARPSARAGIIDLVQTSLCLVLYLFCMACTIHSASCVAGPTLTPSLTPTSTLGLTCTPCISTFACKTICILQKVLPAFALAS